MEDLYTGLEAAGDEEPVELAKEDTPSPTPEESGFLMLSRVQDTRPRHLDGGRTVLRPSLPYDDKSHMMSCFLDLYIGAKYAPAPSLPGCVCHATVIYGTVSLTAEGQDFQLLERDAIRFKADQPYHFGNMSSGTGRLLLEYQYLQNPAESAG